jgi:hypothetical protein
MKHPDADTIERLGGPTKVADMLSTTPQRVWNWTARGIPALVKLNRPDLFPHEAPIQDSACAEGAA